jgi:DNA primase
LPSSWVPGYLASRSLDAALLPTSPWKIGYAPASWTALRDYLRGQGFCGADMLSVGLVVTGKNGQLRDHFHDRLIVPLRTEDGIAVGFIGRRRPGTGEDYSPIFTKGRVLAGLAEAGTRSGEVPSPS